MKKRLVLLVSLVCSALGLSAAKTSADMYYVSFELPQFAQQAAVSNLVLTIARANGLTNDWILTAADASSETGDLALTSEWGVGFTLAVNLHPGYRAATLAYVTGGITPAAGTFSGGAVPHSGSAGDIVTAFTNLVVTPETYTLTFDPNGAHTGAQVSPAQKTVTYAAPYGELPVPTLAGYAFRDWRLAGTETVVAATDTVRILTPTNLVATWTPIAYTLAFDGNGGTGQVPAETRTYDVPAPLPANGFTRDHFAFVCWSNVLTSATYAPGASVVNLTNAPAAVVTLAAVWTPQTYTVRYHSNLGAETVTTAEVAWGAVLTLKGAMVKQGYTFLGWAPTATATAATWLGGEEIDSRTLAFGADGSADLYAVWEEPRTYTVTLDANGGGFALDGATNRLVTVNVGEPWGAFPAVTNANVKLAADGWQTTNGVRIAETDLVPVPSKGIATLLAVWRKNDPLAQALDAEALDVEQTAPAGTGCWVKLADETVADATNGNAAAVCVTAGARNGSVEMTTQVVGPGRLTFRWKMQLSAPWPAKSPSAAEVWSGGAEIDGLTERLWFSVNATGLVGIAEGALANGSPRFARFTDFVANEDGSPPTPQSFELLKKVAVGWTNETVRVVSSPQATNTLAWTFHTMNTSPPTGTCFVDAVVWTPDGANDGFTIFLR